MYFKVKEQFHAEDKLKAYVGSKRGSGSSRYVNRNQFPTQPDKELSHSLQVRSVLIMARVAPRHQPNSVPPICFPIFAFLSSPNS